jgi:lysophospholipase L1-like esterase
VTALVGCVRGRRWILGTATVVLLLVVGAAWAPPALAAAPTYTALGDSYASGVGTRTYYSNSGSCYRSPDAYPVLAAAKLGATLTFAACSGATTTDVLDSQLGSLSASTTYVSVTVGGDDVGFTSVMETCDLESTSDCDTAIANAEAEMTSTLPADLDTLFAKIQSLAPNAEVVVVTYPHLFNGQECNLIMPSSSEQAELNSAADLLDTTIEGQASKYGFSSVDPRAAFTGHAICASVEWINGLSWPLMESYHPNVAGQQGYASLLEPAF